MQDTSFRILYLGEDQAWAKISGSLTDAAHFHLKIHRAQSLNELFLILAGGEWHAAAIDVQAWKYQGLHYVDKIRSEYPAFPLLALYSAAESELAGKARNCGASRCLMLEELSSDGLQLAVLSCLSEKKAETHSRKSPVQASWNLPEPVRRADMNATTKAQVISHALNNLLCVITANADVLADQVGASAVGARSLHEIKKAAKSAADLMRFLK